MSDSERKDHASLHLDSSDGSDSLLAHWPPPMRAKESRPVLKRPKSGQPVQRAQRRGWRLTRAMFAEFEDEE